MIAAGKAAYRMAAAAARLLGPRLRRRLVIAPQSGSDPDSGPQSGSDPYSVVIAGHPIPNAASEEGGRQALAAAKAMRAEDTLLVLLSGGASALMALPAEGLTLADKVRTTEVLLRSGADIHALNTVRKHLSAVKGGRLAAAAAGRTLTLAISDVVGDDLSVIGSGPTIGDPTTFADALNVLRRYGSLAAYPPAVASHLERGAHGEIDDTPKPSDARLRRSEALVIGGRHDAMRGAAEEAQARGYTVDIVEPAVVGEAREVAPDRMRETLASRARRSRQRPCCVISSGETTVRVTGSGRGGRNQEFALAAADVIQQAGGSIVLASFGTDGVDGPTDAAGAIVDSTTMARARTRGLAPRTFLDNNNAYAFFQALGDLIHTGPTGTNVGDVQIILLA
jgi:hydroxypyruvate reductase